jgi:divalent metal cation (Fe/Co/Zn/Cd) transporter
VDELEAGYYLRRFWVEAAIIITWSCILILSLYCLACIIVAVQDGSSALLAYGLESLLDVLSSFFVVWRFWGAWGKDMISGGDRRETKASVGISFFFVVLAGVVIAAAIEQYATQTKPEDATRIIILSSVGFVLSIIMGLAKLKVAYETSSSVMYKDAWASFAGAVLSLGTLLGALIYEVDEDFWWIDPTVALITGLFLAIYGLRTLIRYRWWTRDFWYGD